MDDLWPNKMVQDDSAGGAGADAADSGDADEEVDADMEAGGIRTGRSGNLC